MYILVRNIPNKSKIVWEGLVDVKKVWLALDWLKKNNHLYKNINLPDIENCNKLLDGLRDPEFQEEKEEDEEEEKKALLTLKSQSDSFYDEYTICPLHNKTINDQDTKIYQMLKVYDECLDFQFQDLDLQCFPYHYPDGKCGHCDAEKKSSYATQIS